jgi:hypothetical protein
MYRAEKSVRQKNKANARTNNYPFLQPQNLELLLEVNMASRAKHGSSALQSYRAEKSVRQKNKANARTSNYPFFTAPKFRASVGSEHGLTRETWIEPAAKCFYSAKIKSFCWRCSKNLHIYMRLF